MASSRSRLRIAAGVLFAGILTWLGIEWYASRQPVSGDFTEEIARKTGDVPEAPVTSIPEGMIRLAIGPLGTGSTDTEAIIADLLTAELSDNTSIHLIERREMRRILGEFHLNTLGAVAPAEAIRLGKLVGADWFLLGAHHGSGTNMAALVRIVDARSGILRDISIVPGFGNPAEVSALLAGFVRKGLEGGTAISGNALFASIGGFEDMSLRPRHAGIEAELRAHLGASLASRGYRLLERQLTHDLLSEIQLATLGFIESTNPPPRFQTSVLLIDGIYQSFDTTGDEIELTLRVSRIGGERRMQGLRATGGPSLLSAAETATVRMTADLREAQRPPTRRGEVRAQIESGMERSRLKEDDLDPRRWSMIFNRLRNEDEATAGRRGTNLLAAIQSFESALLLDPRRSDAKLFLARCLVDPHVNRLEDARNHWRELAVLTNAGPAMRARVSMGFSYLFDDQPKRAAECLQELVDTARTEEQRKYYTVYLDYMRWLLSHTENENAQTPDQRREQLTQQLQKWNRELESGRYQSPADSFRTFLGSKDEAEARLDELRQVLEQLAKDMPRVEPYLWATALDEFRRTNDPIVAHFERSLEQVARDPKAVPLPSRYFESMTLPLRWAFEKGQNPVSLKIAEALGQAQKAGIDLGLSPWWHFKMGYAYLLNQRWREALTEFEGITNRIIAAEYPGPWGGFPAVQAPMDYSIYCRRQLGETNLASPWDEHLKKSLWFSNTKPVFIADARQAWIVTSTAIIDLDPESGVTKTNALNLPFELKAMQLAQSEDQLWIGTDGYGLLAYDKRTRAVRQFLESDGLLFNSITALHFDGNQLWLGCANGNVGGLCRLDPASNRFKTYAPALAPLPTDVFTKNTNGPPRHPVMAIGTQAQGQLWVGSKSFGWQQAEPDRGLWNWYAPFGRYGSPRAISASEEWVALGEAPSPLQVDDTRLLGLLNKQRGELIQLGMETGLPYPAVTALCFDKDRLWVGGPGYLARMNLNTRKVENYFLRSNTQVNTIQIVGDSLWLGFSRTIFRIPRPR